MSRLFFFPEENTFHQSTASYIYGPLHYNKVGKKRFLSPRINHSRYFIFLPLFLTSYDHNLPLPPLHHLFPFLFVFFSFFFLLWFFHMEIKNIKIKISDERGINETLIMEYKNLFMAFKENMFFFPSTSGPMLKNILKL